jgi:hypothetical protein
MTLLIGNQGGREKKEGGQQEKESNKRMKSSALCAGDSPFLPSVFLSSAFRLKGGLSLDCSSPMGHFEAAAAFSFLSNYL